MAKGSKGKGKKQFKKRVKKNVPAGICHIKATFNNTVVTFSDLDGNTLREPGCCASLASILWKWHQPTIPLE